MKLDSNDLLLDAFLEEVLGGRTPPNLSGQILRAAAAERNGDANVGTLPRAVPLSPAYLEDATSPHPPAQWPSGSPKAKSTNSRAAKVKPRVELAARQSSAHRKRAVGKRWMMLSVAACLGGIGLLVLITVFVAPHRSGIAKKSSSTSGNAGVVAVSPSPRSSRTAETPASGSAPGSAAPRVAPLASDPAAPVEDAPKIAAVDPSPAPDLTSPESRRHEPTPDAEIVSFVNTQLAQAWSAAGVSPAEAASDEEWCGRVFSRLLGREPANNELRAFVNDKQADKRERLVQRLLTNRRYADEFAKHWAGIWSNILIGPSGGLGNSLASRDGLKEYLQTAFSGNKPYNQMVVDLLTATGAAKPEHDDYNPAVNFLLDRWDGRATTATARVSRVFLGRKLVCAQCHDDPSRDSSQEQFWAFNSFFRQMRADRQETGAKLANADFWGEGRGSKDGEIYFETPAKTMKSAFPQFLDGTKISPAGELAKVDRRKELARMITQSDDLSKTLVNRVWSHFFSYGFTQPVDDMGPGRTPSQPEVLDRLSREFAAHGYDMRSLIRWVALSEPFSRSSKVTDLASKDVPEAGDVPLFSRYYSRSTRAAAVYTALAQGAKTRTTVGGPADAAKARVDWLKQFNRGKDGDKSLANLTGDFLRRTSDSAYGGLLQSICASDMPFDQKVEHLFLGALSRLPNPREVEAAKALTGGNEDSKAIQLAALQEIWSAIVNSNELVLDK